MISEDILNTIDAKTVAINTISRVSKDNAFVSYSQHGEDVLLNRVFSHKKHGRYIDIGANHPINKSVSYASFLRGWTGITIDMDSSMIDLYKTFRPRDIAIHAAISDEVGLKQAFIIPGSTRSSLESDVGGAYQDTSFNPTIGKIRCVTLTEILNDHKEFLDCDFLNIDVEGHEASVLRGIDFTFFRPRVIVVEAIHPITRKFVMPEWDFILFEAGYTLALFDGLNSYFVLNEEVQILNALNLPPNYSDNYVRFETLQLANALLNCLR